MWLVSKLLTTQPLLHLNPLTQNITLKPNTKYFMQQLTSDLSLRGRGFLGIIAENMPITSTPVSRISTGKKHVSYNHRTIFFPTSYKQDTRTQKLFSLSKKLHSNNGSQ
uniref:Uncharacterized protein n=1 Tax=Octopus bimaculoides TaxID=37653 RepID=A0A0L8FIM4_OCTBM